MRGKQAPKRKPILDSKYQNPVVAKLINLVMRKGKKTTAQSVVYGAFVIIQERTKQEPIAVFEQALKNIAPLVEVKSRRIGGSNYQIPIPVRTERRQALAFRWLITGAQQRKGKPMAEKLAEELLEAAQNQGFAAKKRADIHRMAEANRAFAHFAR